MLELSRIPYYVLLGQCTVLSHWHCMRCWQVVGEQTRGHWLRSYGRKDQVFPDHHLQVKSCLVRRMVELASTHPQRALVVCTLCSKECHTQSLISGCLPGKNRAEECSRQRNLGNGRQFHWANQQMHAAHVYLTSGSKWNVRTRADKVSALVVITVNNHLQFVVTINARPDYSNLRCRVNCSDFVKCPLESQVVVVEVERERLGLLYDWRGTAVKQCVSMVYTMTHI